MEASYLNIIERMKGAGRLKNDSAVARVLEVTPQALSNYKKRGKMPMNLVLKFSNIYGLSLDWLLTGDGDVYKAGYTPPEGEENPYTAALEGPSPYGRDIRGDLAKFANMLTMSPEEVIYIGKLLKVLRESNPSTITALKLSIDAFLAAIVRPAEPETKNTETKPQEPEGELM